MNKKRLAIIGIVCLLLAVIFAVSYYYAKQSAQEENKNMELVSDEKELLPPVEVEKVSESQIGGDTEYIVDHYDVLSKTHAEEKAVLPPECIGMERSEFMQYLSEKDKNPSAKDKQEGFCESSLLSFSGKRVVIRKSYDMRCVYVYLLRAEKDGKLGVYERESGDLFLLTDIDIDCLPQDIKKQCQETGYPIKETKDLYDFLESYSS